MKPYRSIESIRNTDALRADERKADPARGAFLRALDDSEFAVDDWEAEFLGSFLDFTSNRPSDEPRWWTTGRRAACDRMALKYPDLARAAEMPSSILHPPSSPVAALGLPSIPGQCDYLVRGDDRRQRRCGQVAVVKLRAGLELCAEHEQQRQQGIERLRKFKERQLHN